MKAQRRYFKDSTPHRAPPLWLAGLEPGRLAAEVIALNVSRSHLLMSEPGDGHPVMVLPGLFASDTSTGPLRGLLNEAGYNSSGWQLGTNLGPRAEDDLEARLTDLIDEQYENAGNQAVSLIGWSLGGVYARLAGHLMPNKVRQVITLGSPISGSPKLTNAWRLFELISDVPVDARHNEERLERAMQPLSMPCTSIYSKTDAIVAWQISQAAVGNQQQTIAVPASHIGMAFSPLVINLLLQLLPQHRQNWQAFEPQSLIERTLYNAA